MRGVVARVVIAVLLSAGLQGCERTIDATDDAPSALRAALAARTVYPAKREEWRADITRDTDSTMVPRVFRASRTTVALVQSSPTRISLFELNRHGMLLASRPARIDAELNAEVPRDIVAPTELSRVTDEGQFDIIDSGTTTLVRESIGGFMFRRQLPMLRGGSGRLCTVSPATLLHIRELGDVRTLEAFTLTAIAAEDSLIGRHRFSGPPAPRMRFGNGDSRRCLLIAEREIFIVSAPSEKSAGAPPRLKLLRPPGVAASPRHIDSAITAGGADTTALLQPYVVDAAIVDGGFVVLLGVVSGSQGRIIDYYNERGEYIQSAMLPFTASAMTGAGPRFLALHQDEKYRWWLSSWVTPMAAHGATSLPDPPRVDQAPERQLFERPPVRRVPPAK
ncbi:MAG: hypothetical protein IT353_10480 [Gemmatimonadaceae bacterium]|nr:hypothetical protein [Gemmatimonadaceae bacterium]